MTGAVLPEDVWLAVRFGVAKLPEGTNWVQVYGVSLVAGIGFTMSLFIAGLAFSDPEVFRNARLSVVVGSLLSAAGGVAVLRFASCTRPKGGTKSSGTVFMKRRRHVRMRDEVDKE